MAHKSTYNVTERIGRAETLAAILETDLQELESLLANKQALYHRKIIKKKDKSDREVYSVDRRLKNIQKLINSRIFSQVSFASYLQGSISDPEMSRDYISCATHHCPSAIVGEIDIKDFFNHITQEHIENIFKEFFKFNDEISDLLTQLCSFNDKAPQGAPTSSYLANLVFHDKEPLLSKLANEQGLRYTRLLDDIVISSPLKNSSIDHLFSRAKKMIETKGFDLNKQKTRIRTLGPQPLQVHGIVVVDSSPKITKRKYREIRSVIHNTHQSASQNSFRTTYKYYKRYHHAYGLLSILKRVGHPAHPRLKAKLTSAPPLPSKRFKAQIFKRLARLEGLHESSSDKVWFRKDWNRLNHELGLLKRTFWQRAIDARQRLLEIKPDV